MESVWSHFHSPRKYGICQSFIKHIEVFLSQFHRYQFQHVYIKYHFHHKLKCSKLYLLFKTLSIQYGTFLNSNTISPDFIAAEQQRHKNLPLQDITDPCMLCCNTAWVCEKLIKWHAFILRRFHPLCKRQLQQGSRLILSCYSSVFKFVSTVTPEFASFTSLPLTFNHTNLSFCLIWFKYLTSKLHA